MALSRTKIPKPENHQDFERLCTILWGEKLGDPNIQRYGRSGTGQSGIDIIGIRDDDPRKRVGIQCKLKNSSKPLTKAEIVVEFTAALDIRPPLAEFHVVTTADRDPDLQDLVSQLEVDQFEKGRRIRVGYWSWNAISDELGQYPKALLAFDDTYGPFARQTLDRIDDGIDLQQAGNTAIIAKLDLLIATRSGPSDATSGVVSAVERQLDAEINGYRDANTDGRPSLALSQFTKMLDRVQSEDVSGRILFRIKANIGSCHLRLGDEASAIKWLLEAFEHAPEEPKAIANKAFAHLLLEDFEKVLEMGRENLTTEAADEMLSSHVIQAARFLEVSGDPLGLVPEKDRDAEGVQLALALLLRSRNDPTWKEIASSLAHRFPEERLARQLNAEAALDDIIGGSGFIDQASISTADRGKLASAATVLSDLWTETLAAEGKYDEADIALCGNLILAYRAQGDFESAMAILRPALDIPEIDDEFLIRAAGTALEAGDPILDEIILRLPPSPSKNLLIVQTAVSSGDWGTLAALDPDADNAYPPVELVLCRTAIRLGRIWDMAEPELSLSKLIDDVTDNVRASVVVAQFCQRKGNTRLANIAWTNARSGITPTSHVSSRLMAAMYAHRYRLWADVADLMLGHVSIDQDSEELRVLAGSLVQERPIKQRAVEFFENLPGDLRSEPQYRYLQALMHFNRGDLPSAEIIIEEQLTARPTLELVGMLAMVLRRQNRTADITELLGRYELRELEGVPSEKMVIAQELRRAGRERDALDLAYPVLRANANDADINVSFAVLVFSMNGFGEIVDVSEVQQGCWVRLTRDGDKDYSFVIEEGKDDPTGGFLAPTHQLASLALGKHPGDTLTLPQQFGDPVVWTVSEIKHRYLHAFQDLLDNFPVKFPNAKGLFSVSFKDDDMSSIINQLKLMAERGEKAVDLHVTSGLPIQLVAGLFKRNQVEMAGSVAESNDIRTCLGNAPEQIEAKDLILNHGRKGVVMDAHCALTAASLDLLDFIKDLLGPISLPQSARDALLDFRGFDDLKKYPAMSLVHRNNQTYRHERDQETDEAREAYISDQIAKIEAICGFYPVAAPNELSTLERVYIENCGERIFDPIFLCTEGRILVSEDLTYRQLAKQTRQVDGVWLQALLMYARSEHSISEERYADAVVNLAILRHGPVAVDPRLIRDVAKQDPSPELRRVEALSRYIGQPGADWVSHARVVQRFIQASAEDKTLDRRSRRRVMSILLRSLIRRAQTTWPWVLESVDHHLPSEDREYIYGWLKGHFLDPRILLEVRRRINAYVRNQLLAAMRQGTETSSIGTTFGRVASATFAPATMSAMRPRESQRPDIPRKKRGRRRNSR